LGSAHLLARPDEGPDRLGLRSSFETTSPTFEGLDSTIETKGSTLSGFDSSFVTTS